MNLGRNLRILKYLITGLQEELYFNTIDIIFTCRMGQSGDAYLPIIKGLKTIASESNLQNSMVKFQKLINTQAKVLSGEDMKPFYWIRDNLQAHLYLEVAAKKLNTVIKYGNSFQERYSCFFKKIEEMLVFQQETAKQKQMLINKVNKVNFRDMNGKAPTLLNKVDALVEIVCFCQVLLKNLCQPKMDPQFLCKFDFQVRKTTFSICKYSQILMKNKQTDKKIRERHQQSIREINAKYPGMKLHPSSQFSTLFKNIELSFEQQISQKNKEVTYIRSYMKNLCNSSIPNDQYLEQIQDDDLKDRFKMLRDRFYQTRTHSNGVNYHPYADYNEQLVQRIEQLQLQNKRVQTYLSEMTLSNQNLRQQLSESQQIQQELRLKLEEVQTARLRIQLQKDNESNETGTMIAYIQNLRSLVAERDQVIKGQKNSNLMLQSQNSQLRSEVMNIKETCNNLQLERSKNYQQLSSSKSKQENNQNKRIQQLIQQDRHLKEKIYAAEVQLKQLNSVNYEKQRQIQRLKYNEKQLVNNMRSQQSKLEQNYNQIVANTNELTRLNELLQLQRATHRNQIQIVKQEKLTLENQIKYLKDQKVKMNPELISLREQLQQLKSNNKAMQSISYQQRLSSIKIVDLEKSKSELQTKNRKIQGELETATQKINGLTQKNMQVQLINSQLQQEINKLKGEAILLSSSEAQKQQNLSNLIIGKQKLQAENKSLRAQIQQLSRKNQQVYQRLQSLSYENSKIKEQEINLKRQFDVTAADTRALNQQLRFRNKESQEMTERITTLEKEKQDLGRRIEDIESAKKNLESSLSDQINKLHQAKAQSINKVQSLQDEKKAQERFIQQLKTDCKNLSDEKIKLESQLKDLRQKYNLDEETLKKLQEEIQNMKQIRIKEESRVKQLQQKINKNQKQIASLSTELSNTKQEKQSLQRQYDRFRIQNGQDKQDELLKVKEVQKAKQHRQKELNDTIRAKERQIYELSYKQKELNDQIMAKERQISELSNKFYQFKIKVQQQQGQMNIILQNMKTQKQQILNQRDLLREKLQILSSKQQLVDPKYHSLFLCDIFEDDIENKIKLIAHLEDYKKAKIIKSKLIYKYDPLNTNNLHKYIDDKPGLLCVAKTQNAIVAGFYPGALRNKVVLDEGGLIISVTNNKSYTLAQKTNPNDKKIYKGMVYDQYYVIFGNSELRLKSGTKEVMSMFNTNASYFNNGGDKVSCILNQGDKRETTFELCEYYQVFFDQKQKQ